MRRPPRPSAVVVASAIKRISIEGIMSEVLEGNESNLISRRSTLLVEKWGQEREEVSNAFM